MPHLPHGHFVSRKMLVLVVGRVSGQKARGTLGSHDAVVTSGLALNLLAPLNWAGQGQAAPQSLR